jgi:hypothetical protein
VVQVFTDDPASPGSVRVTGAVGADASRRVSIEANDRHDAFGWLVGAQHFATDGFRTHSAAERNLVHGKLAFGAGATRAVARPRHPGCAARAGSAGPGSRCSSSGSDAGVARRACASTRASRWNNAARRGGRTRGASGTLRAMLYGGTPRHRAVPRRPRGDARQSVEQRRRGRPARALRGRRCALEPR